jgi:alpha-tubulin suppressor-like RCC1 family protein
MLAHCIPPPPTPLLVQARMSSVSCGPYHTAAITTEGLLYTWGDGAFGRLGLGNTASFSEPQLVTELAEKWVQQVGATWAFLMSWCQCMPWPLGVV